MSTFSERDVACPHCGKETRRTLAESLNLGRSPWYAEPILDGTFQVFRCPTCNQQVVVDHPLMVVDFDTKRWIASYPRQWEPTWPRGVAHAENTYRDTLITYAPPMVSELREGLVRRVVYGLDALREKLVALQNGLDDAWLETLKLDLWRAQPDLAFGPETRPRLFAAGETLDFNTTATDGTARVMRVDKVALERLQAEANLTQRAFVAALTESTYVDLGRILFYSEAEG
ncbi:MAG TPA: CpXC domain-containing protein [Myxococcota bacterium]|nr:CpXC domain-containing protein [Myxococcota bacterium]